MLVGAGVLFFLDAPFLTMGRGFLLRRNRERLILFSLELDCVALWAVAVFLLRWRWPLAPAAAALPLAWLGLLLTAAGMALSVWAKLRLGRWFSGTFAIKEGHELVTDGPYAVTRHPIYTGVLASLAGAALVWNSALTLALAAAMAVPLFFHTVYEEALFEKHFGAAYFDYQRRVPRLVPFTRPRRPRAD
jgi:protein-S-isoprenylcysteine O-methyltransferase Ste14